MTESRGPLTNFAKIAFGAYIDEFGVDRRTLGSIDKLCHMQKKCTFFWGAGEHSRTSGKTSNSMQIEKKNLRILLSHGQDLGHIGLMSKRVVRNELFGGEFTRRLKNLR